MIDRAKTAEAEAEMDGHPARCAPKRRWIGALLATSLFCPPAFAATPSSGDALAAGFQDPPASARPRVWWHWMNGNVTKDGIAKDLAWMKRAGIGGLQAFDVGISTPQIVERRLAYMTPEWKDAFRFAAGQADRAGLELAIAASPGWSETGGPWTPPRDAMKKLVWSETSVTGGRRFAARLAPPPTTTGPFQALRLSDAADGRTFYGDVAVLAYPDTSPAAPPSPRFSSGSGEPLDAAAISDDSLETFVRVAGERRDEPGVVLITYDTPQTIRSASLYVRDAFNMFTGGSFLPRLEVRDGSGWRSLADVPVTAAPTTVSFAPVTAREFRLVLGPPLPRPGVMGAPRGIRQARVADLRLSADARVDRFEAKAGFTIAEDYQALDGHAGPDVPGVPVDRVIDLTSRMRPDGSLDWTPPPGRWRVLRLGYSLLGVTNHPAAPEATGLEVDKYDGEAVRRYMETYLGMYRDAAGPELMGARGVRAVLTDSTEVGASNWTPQLIAQFRRLRGYDPTPWLPALTGVVVGSRSQSDAFLYDFRRTLADLVASEHYGQVAAVAHARGLKVYGEALEGGRTSLGDDMAMRAHTDLPMAALWTYPRNPEGPEPRKLGDLKGAASVAHVYGQNLAAAESLTSAMQPWAHAPADLKRIIDLEFASGINLPVIHTSVHQPVDDKVPGLSLSVFGQYFNRHETWAEMARPWIDYIARSSFLLQQGRDVSDVAYFYGEEAPLTVVVGEGPLADAPRRYGYDFVNSDALLAQLSVDGADLVAKSGARYRALYLGGSSRRMTLPVLRRLAQLAAEGATIVGVAPQGSPSLADDKAEFDRLVRQLWAGGPVTRLGRGQVIASKDVEAALAAIGARPDFAYQAEAADSEVLFVHRRLEDGEIYFLNNRKNRPEAIEARFRVTGRRPEIWRADTGAAEPVSFRVEGGETIVPLPLLPEDALFVVFRKPAAAASLQVATPAMAPVAELAGPWSVSFQPDRGAPASIILPTLGSLSTQADPGVKYFSGVATYTRTFRLPKTARPGAPLFLDLGQVGDVAEVWLNGQKVGGVWKAPYRLDIGPAVRRGKNMLEIRVANLWVNRLIGDAQPGARKITFTTNNTYGPKAPLRPAGLIGPVILAAPEAQAR